MSIAWSGRNFRRNSQLTKRPHFWSQFNSDDNTIVWLLTRRQCSSKSSQTQQGPMSPFDRAKGFASSVSVLWKDFQLYQSIDGARTTPRNMWTRRETSLVAESTAFSPRRQILQQRQFLLDIRRVLPVVLMWIVPVVGNLPMFASVFFPRQLLSRQFYNDFEVFKFARQESKQRFEYYSQLSSKLRDSAALSLSKKRAISSSENEAILIFLEANIRIIALALGIFQSLPGGTAKMISSLAPKEYLRRRVYEIIDTIGTDDLLLEREGYLLSKCRVLSDLELLDACQLRGLRIEGDAEEMRRKLLSYLETTLLKDEIVSSRTRGMHNLLYCVWSSEHR